MISKLLRDKSEGPDNRVKILNFQNISEFLSFNQNSPYFEISNHNSA